MKFHLYFSGRRKPQTAPISVKKPQRKDACVPVAFYDYDFISRRQPIGFEVLEKIFRLILYPLIVADFLFAFIQCYQVPFDDDADGDGIESPWGSTSDTLAMHLTSARTRSDIACSSLPLHHESRAIPYPGSLLKKLTSRCRRRTCNAKRLPVSDRDTPTRGGTRHACPWPVTLPSRSPFQALLLGSSEIAHTHQTTIPLLELQGVYLLDILFDGAGGHDF